MKPVDLESYFKQIKLAVPSLQGLSTQEQIAQLVKIYTSHIQTFPYSNEALRKIAYFHPLQRPNLSFYDYKNLLSQEHGGYCFQIAILLHEVLHQLGYKVSYCAAKVLMGATANAPEISKLPPTHLILQVTIENEKLMLDPGLGSIAPKLPLPISDKETLLQHDGEEFRLYPNGSLYVLEKKMTKGWLSLIQTDFLPLNAKEVAMNLRKLGFHPAPIAIRDSKMVIGIVTDDGRKTLIWDAQSKQLKYVEHRHGETVREEIVDFKKGQEILVKEFDITHISTDDLAYYCSETHMPRPQKPWTVQFPLDEAERKELEKNLMPAM